MKPHEHVGQIWGIGRIRAVESALARMVDERCKRTGETPQAACEAIIEEYATVDVDEFNAQYTPYNISIQIPRKADHD